MARAIWTGSVGFGLVNVPVALFSATEDHTVHFSQFQRDTPNRIRYRRINEETGEEVDYSDIVKGYDIGGGDYVIVTPDELEEIEPGRSRTIEISDFVDQSEIDPIYYQKTYYLAPQGDGADRPYGLLLQAMQNADRVGIATFVMRDKQYLAAIRPAEGVLALETMFFPDEVRDPAKELDRLPKNQRFSGRELDMALALIESMTVPWKAENYRDTYRDRVMELIDAKRRGEQVVTEGREAEPAKVVDLMDALQRSLESAESAKPSKGKSRSLTPAKPHAEQADLGDLSRDDLYQRAQHLGIPGRSKMSREDLIEAIHKSDRPSRPRSQRRAS
jgi:DNA end-binding protein Ku